MPHARQFTTEESGQRHREREALRSRAQSRASREIGPLPEVVDPPRKAASIASLQAFCEAYFGNRITLAWCPDHLKALARLEEAIRYGGQFAWAMPRGSGKSTLTSLACLWALATGFQQFVVLIGASIPAANDLMAGIKSEILTNALLLEDWPEICFPARALQGIVGRAAGQTCNGHPTSISWRPTQVVLPTIPGSKASGAILRVAGITGSIRGLNFVRPDGASVRPGLVVIDDPSTDRSAKSPSQNEEREKIIGGAILGLAGPRTKIAAVCPCTVIRQGDLADRLLDRDKKPDWNGERFKMVYSFPTNTALWDEYAEVRANELRSGGRGQLAAKFYLSHRAAMDEGGEVAWAERKNPEEESGLQHAMNLMLDNREAFFAEYQNSPLMEEDEADQLQAGAIAKRVNGVARGCVPGEATRLTAYVDIQQKALFWLVAAWTEDFAGSVIDYGTYPEQGRKYFTLANLKKTLERAAPGTGLEGSIHAGLTMLADRLLTQQWSGQRIEKLLIDANWGASTDVVYTWCRASIHAQVMPAHGRYVGAASVPWADFQKQPGERLGYHWILPPAGARGIKHFLIDTNFWKTFVASRLTTPLGDKGTLTLFGKPGEDHRMLADQFCSEFRVRTEGRGRTVDEWKLRPAKPDNHFWDAVCGAAAAASLLGCALPASMKVKRAKEKVSFSAQQKARGGA